MNYSKAQHWIWLQMCIGVGKKFKDIIEEFGSIENLYNANIIEWRMSTQLTPNQIEKLQKYTLEDAQKIIDVCNDNNWQIITYDDFEYPQRLREISNPPAVLYVDGELPNIDNNVVIGIVGTRKPTSYAIKCANVMAKGISMCGAIVVSGGALGVDSASHRGALEVGAITIAVLGCGLGSDYLGSNQDLRDKIKLSGALVTEFPPFVNADRFTFPMRNRIISGLSLGLLVVEAGIKSGSLITANFAIEQNRDVYAIPASIFDYRFYGTNKLIDDGATVATSPNVLIERYAEQFNTIDMSKMKSVRDILEQNTPTQANAPQKTQVEFDNLPQDRAENLEKQNKSINLFGDEKIVFSMLLDSFESIDVIADKAGIDTKRVLASLTMLEIKGLVESASGKRYRLK